MNQTSNACERFEERLFAMIEGELEEREHAELAAHLQHCGACLEQLNRERQLTEWLGRRTQAKALSSSEPRRGWAPLVAATIVIALIAALTLLSRNATPAYGSIVSRPIGVEESARQELALSNHIDLPAGTTASIQLPDVATIDVAGPATLELDKVSGDQWKATLVAGQITLKVQDSAKLTAAWQQGAAVLTSGIYTITEKGIDNPREETESVDGSSPAELMDRAFGAFHAMAMTRQTDRMETAAELLAQAIEHPQTTADQKSQAEFYWAAALSNLGRHQEAARVAERWIAANSDDENDTILHILAEANWNLGRHDEARRVWQRLLHRSPQSPYKPHFERFLDESTPPAGNPKSEPDQDEQGKHQSKIETQSPTERERDALSESTPTKGAYLVVTIGLDSSNLDHQVFRDIARQIAEFHAGTVLDASIGDVAALGPTINLTKPENVLFVIPPQWLDVNVHRRILTMAQSIDDDPFVDFAFGYFTARDSEGLKQFWQRTVALHHNGLPNKTWIETSVVAGGTKSFLGGPEGLSETVRAAGFVGSTVHWGINSADPDVLEFVDRQLPLLETASVISMWGNGDPQGIWLFDDSRNVNREEHWAFDPQKVGLDPDGELTRITADRFRQLNLHSPIIWSGTCHCGATCRVFVEPDIVSTFGASDHVELYELKPDESMCLSMIDAGAGALLVPIASNHGWSAMNEIAFTLAHGSSLGEAIKSTYDDVCFQAGAATPWKIVDQGDPINYHDEHIMRSGGANRILIGDPALRLFSKTKVPGEQITVERASADRTVVKIEWDKRFHPGDWNIYGDFSKPTRIFGRVEWPDEFGEPVSTTKWQVQVLDESGRELPHEVQTMIERHHGRTYLHLQATSADDTLRGTARKATFRNPR